MRSVFGKGPPDQRPLEQRWKEREFFFWTAKQWLGLFVLASLVAHTVVAIAQGETPGGELLEKLSDTWASR